MTTTSTTIEAPVIGERWTNTMNGEVAKVMAVRNSAVIVLSQGERAWIDSNEFAATWKQAPVRKAVTA